LIGKDGNIFNLAGIASRALAKAGLKEQAREMQSRILQCHSYSDALGLLAEYVSIS